MTAGFGQGNQPGYKVDSVNVHPSPAISWNVLQGDSFALVVPGPQFRAGPIKRFFAGSHYRKAWNTPVWVPVLNTDKLHGGLTYVKRGGNKQSLVVNVKDRNEQVFTIRSIQKNPVKALPMHMRNRLISKVARDQVSSMHPTAFLIIPKLAEALRITHTHPELFYITSDTALRDAQPLFAGRLVMVEEKYEGHFFLPGYDGPVKSYKTEEAIDAIKQDPHLKVDQRALLRARLLDMILGDWDRSEDQWKWLLKVSPDSSKLLIPVPRDRDQAMVLMDGVFPWFYSQEFMSRKYQGFRKKIHDIIGLNWNARTFDRTFLNELTKEQWMAEADSVKILLTDKVIEDAISSMPEEHRKIDGETITMKIKRRRDAVNHFAAAYYKLVSEDISIQGSKGDDLFVVKRMNDDKVQVSMFSRSSSTPAYTRIVDGDETEEVIIYGNEGADKLHVDGNSDKKVVIRFIGGDGIDTVYDRSYVKGLGKNTRVYDLVEGIIIDPSEETKDLTSYDVRVNENTANEYNYDSYMPKLIFSYNVDQGILAGAGFSYTHEEFRKKPYAFYQEVNYAQSLRKNAFYITTFTDFVNLFGKWGLKLNTFIFPSFVTSFYGLGNETIFRDLDFDFYKVRMNRTFVSPVLYRALNERVTLGLGAEYSRHTAFPDNNKYIRPLLRNRVLHQQFASLKMEYVFRNADYFMERKGFEWKNFAQWKFALTDNARNFSRIGTEASAYYRINTVLNPVLAIRAGGLMNFDAFPFYESAFIGGYNFEKENETLRGFRRNRFAGRSCVFNNNELRLRLITFGFSGEAGIFGFYDLGRVWVDNDNSKVWHSGRGGGVWIKPMRKMLFTVTSAHSKEESLVNVDMGFFF